MRRAFLVCALLLCACGRKGPVKPPELARPAPIADLEARNGAEEIALSWRRPQNYTDGARMLDLGEFRVERAIGDAPDFGIIQVLPITDRERFRQISRFGFADRGVEMGERYRYRVVSVTVDGYASAPSNVVEITREKVEPMATPTAEPPQ